MEVARHNIKELDNNAAQLIEALERLNTTVALVDELRLKVFPRPGWTTPAEFALVAASLTSLRGHVETAAAFATAVAKAAQQVGQ